MDPEPDPESVARAILLRQLTGAPRSRRQLEDALARKGVDEALGARLLDRFTEVGLIDDAEYAQMLVRSQVASRSLARRALVQELRRKGIADEHAEEALAQVDDESEEAAARELLRRRWRSGPGVDPQVQARRAMAMLGRKGYSSGLSSRLVREMVDHTDRGLDEHGADAD
ncbi:regulatory protein RecX [Actinotalea ferrariae]|uniref:regulatory protein RecX n=1 Tax=Actinotalea ferrariae TaxID=1386098 RepID=UPI001C8B9E30|nr:regulatory protein RecX [Actinotalea ferrariae]MBX9244539.1 regulatory protein RecX [Actinotalea ferrariae]